MRPHSMDARNGTSRFFRCLKMKGAPVLPGAPAPSVELKVSRPKS
jgi:hypothetical protein